MGSEKRIPAQMSFLSWIYGTSLGPQQLTATVSTTRNLLNYQVIFSDLSDHLTSGNQSLNQREISPGSPHCSDSHALPSAHTGFIAFPDHWFEIDICLFSCFSQQRELQSQSSVLTSCLLRLSFIGSRVCKVLMNKSGLRVVSGLSISHTSLREWRESKAFSSIVLIKLTER